jgi:hypothetical protein
MLGDPATYNPRASYEETMRVKGTSGLLTTWSIEARKVISSGGKYDGDGDLNAVQAGPPNGKTTVLPRSADPCVFARGVRQEPRIWGLQKGWKSKLTWGASMGGSCWSDWVIRKGKEGAATLIYRGEEGEGVAQGFRICSPCCRLGLDGRQTLPGSRPGWLGEKEKTEKEKRKRGLT